MFAEVIEGRHNLHFLSETGSFYNGCGVTNFCVSSILVSGKLSVLFCSCSADSIVMLSSLAFVETLNYKQWFAGDVFVHFCRRFCQQEIQGTRLLLRYIPLVNLLNFHRKKVQHGFFQSVVGSGLKELTFFEHSLNFVLENAFQWNCFFQFASCGKINGISEAEEVKFFWGRHWIFF